MREPPGIRKLHVLVVDDDENLRLLLSTTFDRPDTTVEEVSDAEAARTAIARRRPDVIVLDVGLPGLDGVTFTRQLKADPATREIGIVLLTGGTLESQAGEDAGAASVVRKPFSPLDLLAAVESAAGASGTTLLAEARAGARNDQLLLYAGDVRRLLEVERRHRRTLERSYREAIGALTTALESRDAGTGRHSQRVQRLAISLTEVVAPDVLRDPSTEFGYLLHDIGKVGIPDQILQKPGKLTAGERRVMQGHAALGAQILAGVKMLDGNGIDVVRHHHERWDGHGYPDALTEHRIPAAARIFAVADALDAMTSDRPYRQAGSWNAALREIERGAGGQFDPKIVESFLSCEGTIRRSAAA
ncbi:MAG: HD domain-containing phosphohydrolase [Gaiellaceae bacterium]